MSEATAPVDAGQENTSPADNGQANEQMWFDSAPDEIKGYIQNKGWDDPLKAVNSYQELEKFRGASEDQLMFLPKDPEAEGAFDKVYNKLGRPEAPDAYEFEVPTDVQVDTEFLGMFKEQAHAIGLNNQQAKALVDMHLQYNNELMNNYQEGVKREQEAEVNQLKSEWGEGFEERAELARRFVARNLPDGMDKTSALNAIEEAIGSAAMLKMFANAGDKFREDAVPDGSGDRPFGYTKEQAAADKVALMNDLKTDPARLAAYNKGAGNDYAKMQQLNKIIAG